MADNYYITSNGRLLVSPSIIDPVVITSDKIDDVETILEVIEASNKKINKLLAMPVKLNPTAICHLIAVVHSEDAIAISLKCKISTMPLKKYNDLRESLLRESANDSYASRMIRCAFLTITELKRVQLAIEHMKT